MAAHIYRRASDLYGSDQGSPKEFFMAAQLPTRQLGSTDLNITRVGFGAWATGGGGYAFGWGPQDDNQSIAAMNRALELGVNWIDTAAVYGLGHSEEVVGRVLKQRKGADRPFVFTKCGLVWDAKDRTKDPRRVLTPASIRKECEASLRRLGIERIDLYQFHWPDEDSGTSVEESWRMMVQLQEEGKVRTIGVSNFDVSLLRKTEAVHHVDSLQPPFSLIKREMAASEIPWCRANRTGVIVYSPMQSGILTETFSADSVKKMAADDWRTRSANFQTPKLERNLALRDALIPIARRHDTTVSALAIAWTLVWPGVTGAIVGARSAEQVDGWIGAATLELAAGDLDDITRAIEKTGAGTGPTRPAMMRESRESAVSAQAEARL
jgi:aryl-alcohol dehydrogenase-like predicted oxidoreductase